MPDLTCNIIPDQIPLPQRFEQTTASQRLYSLAQYRLLIGAIVNCDIQALTFKNSRQAVNSSPEIFKESVSCFFL